MACVHGPGARGGWGEHVWCSMYDKYACHAVHGRVDVVYVAVYVCIIEAARAACQLCMNVCM